MDNKSSMRHSVLLQFELDFTYICIYDLIIRFPCCLTVKEDAFWCEWRHKEQINSREAEQSHCCHWKPTTLWTRLWE